MYSSMANIEFRVPYSQRYLVLGLVGLGLPLLLRLELVGLTLWLVSGIAYHCHCNIRRYFFYRSWSYDKTYDA